MKYNPKRDVMIGVAVVCGFILVGLCIAVAQAKLKADAFERVTGVKVSVWDAIFTDLRVVGDADAKEGAK